MSNVATTKMSSKGQVVIPEEIRSRLGLETGAQFVVMGEKDVVILKTILPSSLDDFENLITKVRKTAKAVGIKKSDIQRTIAKVRSNK